MTELNIQDEQTCPICGILANCRFVFALDIHVVECGTCGKYEVSDDIAIYARANPDLTKKYIYSGAIRELDQKGIKVVVRDLERLEDSVVIPEGPLEAIDRILLHIYREMSAADSFVQLDPRRDYPIAFARSAGEFSFFLTKARGLSYVESHPHNTDNLRLTLEGWKRVSELRKIRASSDQAFVAMWFDDDLTSAWTEGFEKALSATGYKPIRIDLEEHNEKICDRIVSEIRKSGLLVADFTGQRGGVYFEAGFAMGLGIPVVWTCRETDIKTCHFDTRQYNHIVWEEPSDLREKLVRRIEATIPKRPGR